MTLPLFKKAKGMTMVELLIVVAIIVFLAGMTIPSMFDFSKRRKLENATLTYISDVQSLRSKAQSGARYQNIPPSYTYNPAEKWGVGFYCTPANASAGTGVGRYDILYRLVDGTKLSVETKYLNFGQAGTAIRFSSINGAACGSSTYREFFFDKFLGTGSNAAGLFSSGNSVVIQIYSDTTATTKTITIFKNGKITVI